MTSLVVGLGVGACGAKKEPTATERVAQVLDKGPTAPAKPAAPKHVAPDPAAPVEAKPAAPVAKPVEAKPTEPVEKPVEPKPTAPVEKPVEAKPSEPVEVKPSEPAEKPVEPKPIEKPVEPTGRVEAEWSGHVPDQRERRGAGAGHRGPAAERARGELPSAPTRQGRRLVRVQESRPQGDGRLRLEEGRQGDVAHLIDVGSGKGWRTWAEKKIGKKDAGHWQVDVVDEGGHVYHTQALT
ncbi:MAG: DUF2914 domain-containing protein [Myxococcota bacterium]